LPSVWITLPDGSTVSTEDKNIATRLSSSLGKPVRFLKGATASGTLEEYWPDIDGLAKRDVVTDEAMPAETFFDLGMIHLLTTATLDSFRALYPEGRFETRRFRPNLVIQTAPDFKGFPENEWDKKILAIGNEVKIKITGPCGRCVMTTLPQGDLPKDTGILKAAARSGKYFIGSINNEPLELNQHRIETFHLREDFSVFFSSCYVHARKPDETIFRVALEVTQRPPGQCVFIDDRPLNLEAPRRLGIHTIQHQNAGHLRAELRKLGVEV